MVKSQRSLILLTEALRRDATTFDHKFHDFYLQRMKIESAIFQETLMRLRESQRHSLRLQGMEMIRLSQNELSLATKELRNVNELSATLEIVVNEIKNRYENLSKREKILDLKFRGEFPELKQPMVEHLLRHYRKRPKNVQLTCTSVTYLTEIGRCIVSGEKSEILPKDCLEFLRGLDGLDVMPNNLPVQIDGNHWNVLCKLRRSKTELEVKVKAKKIKNQNKNQTKNRMKNQTKNHIKIISKFKLRNQVKNIMKYEILN